MGTLVVINNDEEDQLQAICVPSTPFIAPFWHRGVMEAQCAC